MPKRILVVDDDAINRKLLIKILDRKGFESIEASNGVEALDILKREPIDIVLLDIVMPVMNGLELLQELRKNPQFVGLPVIILTTDDTKKNEALSLGACDVLIKPIKEPELKTLLATYL